MRLPTDRVGRLLEPADSTARRGEVRAVVNCMPGALGTRAWLHLARYALARPCVVSVWGAHRCSVSV